ncbi:MAG: carboxypeptidase regulatory-like domain-containing protein [Bryobacteraceae bacterium]
MQKSCHYRFQAALLLGALAAVPLARTQPLGSITGTITDPSGRTVAEAGIRVVDIATNAERKAVSDQEGRFLVADLPLGTYSLYVTHGGFQVSRMDGLALAAGRTLRVAVELKIGPSNETVAVTAEAQPVDTQAGAWADAVSQQQLAALPLNGRDVFDLAAQQVGVQTPPSANAAINTGLGIHISVNGSRPSENAFRLDGIYIDDAGGSAPASAAGYLLGLEAIAELNVVAAPFSAEYGRTDGGVLTAVSKSGTNDFHGALYEYVRNSDFDAKNFFDPTVGPIPAFRRNQFGGLLGGPILKDKLFFLLNYEGIRIASNDTATIVTPDAQARNGLLPVNGVLKQVPVAPKILPYLALYPLPNGADLGNGTGDYSAPVPTGTREDFATGKLDYIRSERWRFNAHYTFDDTDSNTGDPFGVWTYRGDSHDNLVQAEAQFVPSANTVEEFHAAFSQIRNGSEAAAAADLTADSFVPGQNVGALQVTGLANFGGNNARNTPNFFALSDGQISYSLTRIAGAHKLTAGASFDRTLLDEDGDLDRAGYYQFTSLQNFLAATPSKLSILAPGSTTLRHWRMEQFSGYVQDDVRLGRHLTFGAGVRYEMATTPVERDRQSASLPDPLADTSAIVGGPLYINPSKRNFAPRLSIAWDPAGNGHTVVRAGGGIFYDLLGTRELLEAGLYMPPLYERYVISKPVFPDALASIGATPGPAAVQMLAYRPNQPYVLQDQLVVEHEFGRNLVGQIGYAGARGVHLEGVINDINTPQPQILANGQMYFAAGAPLLNPAFSSISLREASFDSVYHSLNTGLQMTVDKSLRVQSKFTWSKSIDDDTAAVLADFYSNASMQTLFDFRQNRGRSDFDCPFAFATNFIYDLPRPESGAANLVLSGWQLDGTVQAQSGNPFGPIVGFDNANLGGSSSLDGERPNLVLGQPLITGSVQQYFNPLAFSLPANGTLGNLGRNVLQGPGLVMVNLALDRTFWKREKQSFRLRGEVFNVVNHPNFQMPSGTSLFDSTGGRVGGAGQITVTTTSSRQIQLSARYSF